MLYYDVIGWGMAKKATGIRIFKNAWFVRFAKRENISDAVLRDAITKIEKGTVMRIWVGMS